MHNLESTALVTLLLLLQYFYFAFRVGSARGDIKAPAMTGNNDFECKLRVQLNTLEQLILMLPSMWLCAYFFHPQVAAGLGVVFLVGRALYSRAYVSDPSKRGAGMILGVLAYVIAIAASFYGVLSSLI